MPYPAPDMGRVPAGHEPDILLLDDLTPSRYTVSPSDQESSATGQVTPSAVHMESCSVIGDQ